MSIQKNERFGPDGKVVSVFEVDTPDVPNIATIQAARTALRAISAKKGLDADIKTIIDFLIMVTYQYEGMAASV